MLNFDKCVREFHVAYNCPIGNSQNNNLNDDRLMKLRLELIKEELTEVIGARFDDAHLFYKELCDLLYVVYGFAITFGITLPSNPSNYISKVFESSNNVIFYSKSGFLYKLLDLEESLRNERKLQLETTNNSTEFLKFILEDMLSRVYYWFRQEHVDLDACFSEVHRSNMSKLGPDGKPIYREDGKVLKGPTYTPANLENILSPK